MKLYAHINGRRHELTLERESGGIRLMLGDRHYDLTLDEHPGAIRTVLLTNGSGSAARKIEFGWTRAGSVYSILIDGVAYEIKVLDSRDERAVTLARVKPDTKGHAEVTAPIPGRITKILAAEGTRVALGQAVLTLDAMKLENEIQAPREGTVRSLSVSAGTAVEKGQLLFIIE